MSIIFAGERLEDGCKELAVLLLQTKYTVVLTGAGMDTESNIPDFRGKNGLWRNYDPRLVADITTFQQNYDLFHEFYRERLSTMKHVEPHPGHYVLADLEQRGLIKAITTQNISGLHGKAGSKKVYELHGNMKEIFCDRCGLPATEQELLSRQPCKGCKQYALRPKVVLFGEPLPADVWNAAITEIKRSDLLLVIGTSLEVSPVNQLPYLTEGKLVLINNEDRSAGYAFDLVLLGRAGEILRRTVKYLS
ncbi:MAG TPA: NAD-dependent deacylase [Firmicutes bacterium]|nr:NAD-dependent deacylase [Bacillota bacterium]